LDVRIVHQPVLLEALLRLVEYGPESVVVDATVGQGGHALALGGRLKSGGRLIGLDVDEGALAVARERLRELECRVELVQENFGRVDEVVERLGIKQVDVILADLGISSAQLEEEGLGLSFQRGGALDMRLDPRLEVTARDLVNGLGERELADLIYRYGEERASRRIARAIVEGRRRRPIERSEELAEVVLGALGLSSGKGRRSKIHPATRTFQALRVAVNDELGNLERLLTAAGRLLAAGGEVAIISFHSLEDRLVKRDFRARASVGEYEIVTRKVVQADERERRENPRSRSAKLRVARRSVGAN
jgi:16S rRNA (cytosine1402-N4)-methyltransferase